MIVYDGLHHPLMTWQHHITHTLRKYRLQKLDAKLHVEVTRGKAHDFDEVLELCFDDLYAPWVVASKPILHQHDGFNCGPIACLKVLEIYGFIPMNSIDDIGCQKYGYHGIVMEQYKRFFVKHEHDLQVIFSKTGIKKMSTVDEEDKEVDKEDKIQDKETDVNSITSKNHDLAMEKKNKKQ